MKLLVLNRLRRAYCHILPRLLEGADYDYLILAGGVEDSICLKRLIGLSEKRILGIPSNEDDHHIARMLAAYSHDTIEGHLAYLGENVYVAGIGGREPLANISSVLREFEEIKPENLVVVSAYPPYGICDRGSIPGVHYGLHELWKLIAKTNPIALIYEAPCAGVSRLEIELGGLRALKVVQLAKALPCVAEVVLSGGKLKATETTCLQSGWG